ncbi:thiamine pyrophosphokinase [Weizmannia acidilactici]|uniref:Thiamine diphosphokinase n=1 Tax=Weizmannia acidilactici TaxID=2607726 RepID=A0A5J4JIW1_9BACI|nr:thiamine diphosphokinase [Weizmannia acidilactici]GER65581.1 thiamine pyrophosphokinase [Weizmannia acidilactici]GER70408.1 thiamine pyrophosphokinase [Weizmannia acidilactici]GER71938.1 thiamine pyrophosphokinase [Weizmannia acidilactici]
MEKKIYILAGGPVENVPDLGEYANDKEAVWAGVDRGVFHLLEQGIIPRIAFGDFDSVSEAEWMMIRSRLENIRKSQPEKDETDMELALMWAISQEPETIRIFGATGGRADHAFTNILLLAHEKCLQFKGKIEIIDRKNEITMLKPGSYTIEKMESFPYVSFLPITETVENLTLSGFKYPLLNCRVERGTTLCVSNELIRDFGTFSFSSGILMMVRSHD